MKKSLRLVAGDKIELFSDEHHFYKTVIWEILADGTFVVAIPSNKGIPMLLHEGDVIYLIFYRDTGRYMIQAKAKGFVKKDDVRYARLEQISQPKKSQRREYYRLPIRLKVAICKYSEDRTLVLHDESDGYFEAPEIVFMETAEIKDLSVTGAALDAKRQYDVKEKFLLEIHLDESEKGKPLKVVAEAVRISYTPDSKKYRIGVHFLGQDAGAIEFLSKYVVAKQQEQIMKERLLAED